MTQRGLLEPPDDQTGVMVAIASWFKPWLAAATDDSRPSLTAVYIDPAGYAVGADGFMAAIVPCTLTSGLLYDRDFRGALVPADFLKRAHKANGKKAAYLNIELVGGRAVHRVGDEGAWTSLLSVDYPNWRGLLPSSIGTPGGGNGCDLELASLVCEAVVSPFRWYGGIGKGQPLMFLGAENALGLLMPMTYAEPLEDIDKAIAPLLVRSLV